MTQFDRGIGPLELYVTFLHLWNSDVIVITYKSAFGANVQG